MKTFYFTWAMDHPLGGFVQRIDAPDEVSARKAMFRHYGEKWCGCYPLAHDTYEIGDRCVRVKGCADFVRLDMVIVADWCSENYDYIEFRPHKRNR